MAAYECMNARVTKMEARLDDHQSILRSLCAFEERLATVETKLTRWSSEVRTNVCLCNDISELRKAQRDVGKTVRAVLRTIPSSSGDELPSHIDGLPE